MTVTIVFLGKLADLADCPEMQAEGPLDWAGLLAALPDSLAAAASADTTRIAVDGKLLADKATLAAADGAEIALLPPVSGG
jgi:molybdopterin synthase sulfur carrier subunit